MKINNHKQQFDAVSVITTFDLRILPSCLTIQRGYLSL